MYRIEKSLRFVSPVNAQRLTAMFLSHLREHASAGEQEPPPFFFREAPAFAFPGSHGIRVEQAEDREVLPEDCAKLAAFLSTAIHPDDMVDFFVRDTAGEREPLWFLVAHGEHEALPVPTTTA